MDKSYLLAVDLLLGKQLSEEDKSWLQARTNKYNVVRRLYITAMAANGVQLSDFHFTPGDNFMDTPIPYIIDELLAVNIHYRYRKTKYVYN